jgi:hypothetical protein
MKRIDYIMYKKKKRRRWTAVDIDRRRRKTRTEQPHILTIISQAIVILEAIVMYYILESNYYALRKYKQPCHEPIEITERVYSCVRLQHMLTRRSNRIRNIHDKEIEEHLNLIVYVIAITISKK